MKHLTLKAISATVISLFLASNTMATTSLRFGYEAPRSDTQHIAAKKFNKLLKEKTKGELKLSLFPDSTLGNAQTMISAVRGGTIDLEMSGSPNFSGLEPKLNVIDIPFIFQNREHVYNVLDGEIGQKLLKSLEDKGLKGLAFWDVGFRSFTNSKHPVKTPDDIKGLKVRTNQNPMYIQAFSLLGANPVPMPLSELYTALETKAVDAQEHPVGIVWSAKLYEVQKYLSLTNHGYTPLIVVMNKAKFDALSPAVQKALVESAQEAGNYQRQLNEKNEKDIIAKMQKEGIEVLEQVDTKPFRAAIEKEVRKAFIDKNGDELVKQIDALAK
ncbi:TRAP transporter substrate-binding protein [Pasteurella skyensis]|uniref:TRAP transporter substrate-binding protein n=1 Tax=Phocoenobacter skyensis TaxID=97481 RepID=A0AAJ6N9S8_9PAST|nr:TRAP transporter substrate-binding protein [Pasteurella skyensis]MDP8162592.1 TRAP transporter substrate-binding protein [Pasteurella skyensis]MDP8172810.1 TRAP transporter substrate-binding protein [Pasteurella skyensis]MDP8177346.1 TRAP transporter substrate-binding protein [Pasteurella skyensis]MDP8179273.1 TRAP transporter substrate-binding protein [Pasteurella skyensis]MDP8183480.1 TRAP transporter substrate-binding protein [Pasteurella skyensis]